MRAVQVNIYVERFAEQKPEGWPDKRRNIIHVYADSNNFSEALMSAVLKVYEKVKEERSEKNRKKWEQMHPDYEELQQAMLQQAIRESKEELHY